MNPRLRAFLAGLIAIGIGGLSGGVTYGAFNASTSNPGDAVASGSVALGDNDGGSALLTMTAARPGASVSSCIQVTATGSLPSSVEQWASISGTGLAAYLKLKVTRGTDSSPSFGSCANFTADACNYTGNGNGVIYNGDVSAFPTSAATGLNDRANCTPSTSESWTTGETHSYRYDVSFAGTDPAAEGKNATFAVTWEATNQ